MSDPEKGFLKCVIFYLNYFVARKYQRFETDFSTSFKSVRALVITPSQKRLEHMRQAVTSLAFTPPQAKRLLWGTIQEQATKEFLFEAIWQSMDAEDNKLYRIG